MLAVAVVAYAVSPVDLIPDFVPVLGLLDDLALVPAGIWLAIRLIPCPVMADLRARAAASPGGAAGRVAAAVILVIWVGAAVAGALWLAG